VNLMLDDRHSRRGRRQTEKARTLQAASKGSDFKMSHYRGSCLEACAAAVWPILTYSHLLNVRDRAIINRAIAIISLYSHDRGPVSGRKIIEWNWSRLIST
jgi:hypothetical protein